MKLLMTTQEVNQIHNKYYGGKILNVRGYSGDLKNTLFVHPFYFHIHPNDTCVSDCLKSGVLFEKFLLSFVKQFIDPNKNILDIGANIGVHTVVYANYVQKGKVYAFEPQKVVYEILTSNLQVNNCTNVIPYNFGASNVNDTFYMNAFYDEKANQGAFRICPKEESTGLDIQCRRIDELGITNIGYVKIDVEGHEYETLVGMERTLQANMPVMLIEVHESSPTKQDVFAFLEKIGYNGYIRLSHCDYLFMYTK